jgi:hypothetical protein
VFTDETTLELVTGKDAEQFPDKTLISQVQLASAVESGLIMIKEVVFAPGSKSAPTWWESDKS